MSGRRSRPLLEDMRAYAEEAVALLGDLHPDQLIVDRMRYLAVMKVVEVVGEAASKVPLATRDLFPRIEFRQSTGMRHQLVHGYGSIQPAVLVRTVNEDLPALIEAVAEALSRPLPDDPPAPG